MASIRLFGRGRNAAAAGGPAVGAALIADVLESVAAASMSTTWRCRHSAGVSIGEGAVDFTTGRSRSTVIRGKYAFEYVRSGASVHRAPVTDEDAGVGAGVNGSAGARALVDVDADEDAPEPVDGEEFDPELEAEDGGEEDEEYAEEDDGAQFDESLEAEEPYGDDEEGGEDAESELDAEGEAGEDGEDDGEIEGSDDGEGGASHEQAASESGSGLASESAAGSVWERFSDHDACGVHAYAEPAVLAAGVRASGVVQARDAEEFDGVKLSAYAVTLKPKPGDPNRVLARLARQLRDHGANVVVVTAFVDQAQNEDDGEPKIVRLRIGLPHWTPADDPTADHSVSVDLFEFGEPVSVEVPEGAARRTARSCADLGLF